MQDVDAKEHLSTAGAAERLAKSEYFLVCRFVNPFVVVNELFAEDLEMYRWASKGSESKTPIVRKHIQRANRENGLARWHQPFVDISGYRPQGTADRRHV